MHVSGFVSQILSAVVDAKSMGSSSTILKGMNHPIVATVTLWDILGGYRSTAHNKESVLEEYNMTAAIL